MILMAYQRNRNAPIPARPATVLKLFKVLFIQKMPLSHKSPTLIRHGRKRTYPLAALLLHFCEACTAHGLPDKEQIVQSNDSGLDPDTRVNDDPCHFH